MSHAKWWDGYPWRMVQTNLREIDMENMDAKAYARELKAYHATVVTLNAAGIIASYDTALDFQPKSDYLNGDTLKQMIEECHKEGIRVIARCDFSKIRKDVFERHPEWAYRTPKGEVMNYNGYIQTCVNGAYQQEKIFEILKELFTYHDFDGIFCNMSGIFVVDYDLKLYGPCHCENCKKLFKQQYGTDVPDTFDFNDPITGKYISFLSSASKENKQKMYRFLKDMNPAIAVNGFDYRRTECNQDVGRPSWVYQASYNARKITGIDKTMICDDASAAYIGFQYRHSAISPALAEMRQWQNLANGAGTSLYILGTLGKHRDQTGIAASKKAFDFFAEHEDLFRELCSAAKVLLVEKEGMGQMEEECAGWIRMLTELHIPFDQMVPDKLTCGILEGRDLVIVPDCPAISDGTAEMLDLYVENGGTLLATGMTGWCRENRQPRQENALCALGVAGISEKRSGMKSSLMELRQSDRELLPECCRQQLGYIVPGTELLICGVKDSKKTKTGLKFIPDQRYGPPEIAYPTEFSDVSGICVTSWGKGKGVYIPWFPAAFYYREGFFNSFCFMKDVLENICGAKSLSPDCTPMCEITIMEKTGMKLIQLVNTSGHFGNSFFKPVPITDITLENLGISGRDIVSVKAYNGGKAVVSEENGKLWIHLDCLNDYEAIAIETSAGCGGKG